VLRNDDGSAKRPTTTTGIGATASPANPSVTVAGTGTGPPTTTVTAGSVSSGQVTVVSSNAYSSDGTLAIDGETRSMTFVAELRNDGTTTVRVGKAVITAKDAAGNVIGTRRDYPFDVMLSPGETTFLYEFTPSMMYGSDETNSFPEGMATWDLDVPAEADEPGKYDEVNLGVEGVSVTPSGEPVNATGTIRNTSDRPLTANTITVYVALHDADGRLVNVGWTYVEAAGVTQLDPGATMPFEVGVHEGPEAYASWVVGALGSPTL
jgi:hypothetical protein